MQNAEFENILEVQINKCASTLAVKNDEYGTADRLHNFKTAAALQGTSMREALAGMMAKHTVSVYDMCQGEDIYSKAAWDEKITDHINYLLLLQAVLYEERSELVEAAAPDYDDISN